MSRSFDVRPRLLATSFALAGLLAAPASPAIDYPVRIPLPERDLAAGVSGGAALGEDLERRRSGVLGGVDLSLLDGLYGVHLGLHAHRDGRSTRLGGTLEASFWYVLLLGAGLGWSATASDPGPGVPERAPAATLLVGAPFLLARLRGGDGGAFVLVPFLRPTFRFAGGGVEASHHAGLSLRWTSFGF